MKTIIILIFVLILSSFVIYNYNEKIKLGAQNITNIVAISTTEEKSNGENDITDMMKNTYIEVNEIFINSKNIFEKTVALLLELEETSFLISVDRDNSSVLQVSVDNNAVSAEELFDETAQELILRCFAEMLKVSSEEVNIVISKQSPEDNYAIHSTSVDFMFRLKLGSEYIDYGITYCRNIGNSNYKKIEENWYWFEFWLV